MSCLNTNVKRNIGLLWNNIKINYNRSTILRSDKIKKYNILLLFNKKEINEFVLNNKLSSKKVISLSQKIDELQNKLGQT